MTIIREGAMMFCSNRTIIGILWQGVRLYHTPGILSIKPLKIKTDVRREKMKKTEKVLNFFNNCIFISYNDYRFYRIVGGRHSGGGGGKC